MSEKALVTCGACGWRTEFDHPFCYGPGGPRVQTNACRACGAVGTLKGERRRTDGNGVPPERPAFARRRDEYLANRRPA